MEKVKKFVVFPIGLFAINVILSFSRDPWRFWNVFSVDFWKWAGLFLRNLFGSAAYIFAIALLFLFVFTKANVMELFKKQALKAMGIVLFAELLIKFLLDTIIMPLINRQELSEIMKGAGAENGWHAVILVLSSWIVGFGVIYFTLRLLIKSLGLPFSFQKRLFFLVLFINIAISAMGYYGSFQFANHLIESSGATMDTVRIFNMTVSLNVLNAVSIAFSALVVTLQDALIYLFFSRCTKQNHMESPLVE